MLSVLLEGTAKLSLLRSVPKYMQKPINPTVTRYPLSFGLVGGAVQSVATHYFVTKFSILDTDHNT